ncbi:MAG: helix-turn-helix domain-containing protein [Polyangiaceae bacterium]
METHSSRAVGRALRALRETRGLSVSRVCRTARVPPAELRSIEGGLRQPSIAVMERIARSLGSTLMEVVRDGAPTVASNDTVPAPRLGQIPEIGRAIAELPASRGSKIEAAIAATVLHAMDVSGNNQSAAARLLGMERKAFVRKLAKARRRR